MTYLSISVSKDPFCNQVLATVWLLLRNGMISLSFDALSRMLHLIVTHSGDSI